MQDATTCTTGQKALNVSFDVQGNLDNWNGTDYFFDYGNRLRGVYTSTGAAIETYRYDGLGRRVQMRSPAGEKVLSQYARDGKLVHQYDERTSERVDYLYLGSRLVASRTRPISTAVYTTQYQHTDALGSPVAVTDQGGFVLRRDEYEPFGKRTNRANDNRPGFTGHVMDAATGLTYMQQRYYDPELQVFYSVDPVGANPKNGSNANSNPYKFTDPDGRQSWSGHLCDIGGCSGFIAGEGGGGGGGSKSEPVGGQSTTSYNPFKPGYHDYTEGPNTVCDAAWGCTQEEMRDLMSRFAYPGQDPQQPAANGSINRVIDPFSGIVAGKVLTNIAPNGLTIVNSTLPGHLFHDGRITRSAAQSDSGAWTVTTHGIGNSIVPGFGYLNQHFGPEIFWEVDLQMRNYVEAAKGR